MGLFEQVRVTRILSSFLEEFQSRYRNAEKDARFPLESQLQERLLQRKRDDYVLSNVTFETDPQA